MARQTIGEFLATLRRAHGYTQQEVADKLNVSNRAVSTWERNSSMPDVLLLPIIAELYGVTVDEILNGARMDRTGDLPTLSQKAETALLQKKFSRFTTQVFILLGIFFLGLLVLFFGWYAYESSKSPFLSSRRVLPERWEIILIVVGAVTLIVGMTSFVAIWAYAETSLSCALEKKREFRILLRRLVVAWLYVAGAVELVLCGVAFMLTDKHSFALYGQMAPLVFTYMSLGAISLFSGLVVKIFTFAKLGDDTMRQQAKSNRKLSLKIFLWGLIPLAIAIVLVVVFSYVQPTNYNIYYQDDDREEFFRHMETLHIDQSNGVVREGLRAGDYRFNLSELAKTARIGEEIDMGDGFSVKFLNGPYDCVIYYFNGEIKLPFYCKRLRFDKYSVYDLYYRYTLPTNGYNQYKAIYGTVSYKMAVEERNGSMIFARVSTYDLSSLFNGVGLLIVAIDVAVCIAIYCCKRERTEIKL